MSLVAVSRTPFISLRVHHATDTHDRVVRCYLYNFPNTCISRLHFPLATLNGLITEPYSALWEIVTICLLMAALSHHNQAINENGLHN